MSAVPTPGSHLAQGTRVALREFTWADAADVMHMHRDRRLREWLLDDFPLDDAATAQLFLQRLAALYRQREGLGIWHASLRPSGAFVGWFSLMPETERPGRIELGARLLPSAWGQGVSLEGGSLLLDHAFDRLGLEEVWAYCHAEQRSAQLALLTFGYHRRGSCAYNGGLACSHVIRADDWRAARQRSARLRMREAVRHLNSRDAADPSARTNDLQEALE